MGCGPGFLVAVGYMDPGNWATDLAGGAQVRLHAAVGHHDFEPDGDPAAAPVHQARRRHGRDLAQACRDHYPKPTVWFLWILCELAIAACDLAEVVGSAIALQLLFGIPLVWGCIITAVDVMIVLSSSSTRASAISRRWWSRSS